MCRECGGERFNLMDTFFLISKGIGQGGDYVEPKSTIQLEWDRFQNLP